MLVIDTSALIIFDDAHMLTKGIGKDIYTQLNYSLLVSHLIKDAELNHDILQHDIPQNFNEKLSKIRSQIPIFEATQNATPARYTLFANPTYRRAATVVIAGVAAGLTVNSLMNYKK